MIYITNNSRYFDINVPRPNNSFFFHMTDTDTFEMYWSSGS